MSNLPCREQIMISGNGAIYLLHLWEKGTDTEKYLWVVLLRTLCPSLQSLSKALTAFWLDALHVNLATAGGWRKKSRAAKEDRPKAAQASSQAPASGDTRGKEAGGGSARGDKEGRNQLHWCSAYKYYSTTKLISPWCGLKVTWLWEIKPLFITMISKIKSATLFLFCSSFSLTVGLVVWPATFLIAVLLLWQAHSDSNSSQIFNSLDNTVFGGVRPIHCGFRATLCSESCWKAPDIPPKTLGELYL